MENISEFFQKYADLFSREYYFLSYISPLITAYGNSWTLDASVGLWALDAALWTLDSGRWTLDTVIVYLKTESELVLETIGSDVAIFRDSILTVSVTL